MPDNGRGDNIVAENGLGGEVRPGPSRLMAQDGARQVVSTTRRNLRFPGFTTKSRQVPRSVCLELIPWDLGRGIMN